MKKPFIIFLLLLFLCINFVYTEDTSSKNTISGEISAIWAGYFFGILPGLSIEYERLLHKNFALAVGVGMDGLIVPYADLYARWYPGAGMFFADFGLGIWRRKFESFVLLPVLSPGIGWKIDIGKPDGWNLTIGITGRIFFYEDQEVYEIKQGDVYESSVENVISFDIVPKPFFKLGYSF
jgi:hypothetical protein